MKDLISEKRETVYIRVLGEVCENCRFIEAVLYPAESDTEDDYFCKHMERCEYVLKDTLSTLEQIFKMLVDPEFPYEKKEKVREQIRALLDDFKSCYPNHMKKAAKG